MGKIPNKIKRKKNRRNFVNSSPVILTPLYLCKYFLILNLNFKCCLKPISLWSTCKNDVLTVMCGKKSTVFFYLSKTAIIAEVFFLVVEVLIITFLDQMYSICCVHSSIIIISLTSTYTVGRLFFYVMVLRHKMPHVTKKRLHNSRTERQRCCDDFNVLPSCSLSSI